MKEQPYLVNLGPSVSSTFTLLAILLLIKCCERLGACRRWRFLAQARALRSRVFRNLIYLPAPIVIELKVIASVLQYYVIGLPR